MVVIVERCLAQPGMGHVRWLRKQSLDSESSPLAGEHFLSILGAEITREFIKYA